MITICYPETCTLWIYNVIICIVCLIYFVFNITNFVLSIIVTIKIKGWFNFRSFCLKNIRKLWPFMQGLRNKYWSLNSFIMILFMYIQLLSFVIFNYIGYIFLSFFKYLTCIAAFFKYNSVRDRKPNMNHLIHLIWYCLVILSCFHS